MRALAIARVNLRAHAPRPDRPVLRLPAAGRPHRGAGTVYGGRVAPRLGVVVAGRWAARDGAGRVHPRGRRCSSRSGRFATRRDLRSGRGGLPGAGARHAGRLRRGAPERRHGRGDASSVCRPERTLGAARGASRPRSSPSSRPGSGRPDWCIAEGGIGFDPALRIGAGVQAATPGSTVDRRDGSARASSPRHGGVRARRPEPAGAVHVPDVHDGGDPDHPEPAARRVAADAGRAHRHHDDRGRARSWGGSASR